MSNDFEGFTKEDIEQMVDDAARELLDEGFEGTVEDAKATVGEGDSGVYAPISLPSVVAGSRSRTHDRRH